MCTPNIVRLTYQRHNHISTRCRVVVVPFCLTNGPHQVQARVGSEARDVLQVWQNQLQENQVTTCLVICIYMCVCECVSVHVCVKTYRHITIYIYAYALTSTEITEIHVFICFVYIYISEHEYYIYICASNMCMYIYIYIVDRYMSICSNMYKHTHIRIHIYM